MKKLIFYSCFFLLLIAGFLFIVFRNHDFSASTLAVINPNVGDFSFTTQNNTLLTRKDVDGKVYVAEYFFTTCAGICPKMNANMRRVWDEYKKEKDFAILSHTCMPEVDNIPIMKAYEHKMISGKLIEKNDGTYAINAGNDSVENKNWFFLTGDKQALYNIARKGYKIDDGKPDSTQLIKDQFIHTQFFALVDKQGRLRGVYDGLQEEEIQKLLSDIKGLLREKITTKRFMNGFSNNPG